MKKILIYNAFIVNEDIIKKGHILIEKSIIKDIQYEEPSDEILRKYDKIDATGLHVFPGVIDDQVHFREPGLTHKAEIETESKAAVAGGVTSFMEMPNTIPQSTTLDILEEKYKLASKKSYANYSFFLGATNDNIEEVRKINPKMICGLKVFMGSSTGNMLVDDEKALDLIFSESPVLIATHCEDETTIKKNSALFKEKYGEDVPIKCHPEIRNDEACYLSSSLAVSLAKKHNARLHVLHISTEKELALFSDEPLSEEKKITNEVCVHHLWFEAKDYETKGTHIKWNPAVKFKKDRDALRDAVSTNKIDVLATDHAPHTLEEKNNSYFKAPSGGPMIQHSLVSMIELSKQGVLKLEDIATKMSHNPAKLFNIEKRGYVRKGYYADLVLVDLNSKWNVDKESLFYKCKWSPMEGVEYSSQIVKTFVNGNPVYNNGKLDDSIKGMRLSFER